MPSGYCWLERQRQSGEGPCWKSTHWYRPIP
jgi:hypothetical protein